ncbi:MAG: hypothetical protein RLZZ15_3703, partial [Verrucomicrobiota bacterium]
MKNLRSLPVLAFLVFALLTGAVARATINVSLQMQTGNPSNATADANNRTHYLVQRAQFAMDYNDTTREPNWVAWDLTSDDVGSSGRSNFIVDTNLPGSFYQVLTTDYSGSGYDRGHMAPSADRTVTVADNQQVFVMSNMVPQAPDNNQGVWASFETYSRTLAAAGNEILLISGPSLFAGSTIASGVAIPGYTWKIAVVVPLGAGTALSRITAATRVITIKIPNIAGVRSNPWQQYVTSAAQIEADTGYTFFTALSPTIAAALRAQVDGQTAAGTPVITTQPVAQTTAVGGNASFTVAASSTTDTNFTYQWLRNDDPITGNATATTANLVLTNVQAADFATYTVVVTNTAGAVTSTGAALVITGLPPTIVTPPTAITRAAGTTAVFSVTAGGSPTLVYQWRKGGTNLSDGANISGAATATLTVTNVQSADAASYDVVVSNGVNPAATSATAALTVTAAAPTIITPPLSQTVVTAGTATFTVGVSGTAPFTYQWRKGGTNLANGATGNGSTVSGATTATLTLTTVQAADAGSFDVVVSNTIAPAATSTAATLSIGTVASGTLVSYAGGSYTQNFDALPQTGTTTFTGTAPFDLGAQLPAATSLNGWRLASTLGTPTLVAGTGSGNTGAAYSFGVAGTGAVTDRALGTVASGTTVPRFGVMIANNSGTTITQFTLSYTGEQWRNGGNTTAQTLPFSYSTNATDLNTGTFVDVTALGFTSPIVGASSATLDGNTPANRTAISSTVTGITWSPGQILILRWTDLNDAGNDHGLAVD